jgi:hypothetical protein
VLLGVSKDACLSGGWIELIWAELEGLVGGDGMEFWGGLGVLRTMSFQGNTSRNVEKETKV